MEKENKSLGNLEHIDTLKEKLMSVSNEIDSIKNSFSKSAEDLSKIQNMLQIGNLDELGGMLERFESKISEVEKMRTEAADGAKKYREELEKEKERLIKLWDAYKNQEEELSTTEKRVAEFEDRMKNAESSKQQLEEDLTARINTLNQKLQENQEKVGKFEEYKTRCEEFDSIQNQLEREVHNLKEDNTKKEDTIRELNEQVEKFKDMENMSEYKEKFEGMSAEYEKEKERLTKLYHLYEQTETEAKKLRQQNEQWKAWYESNKDIFNKLFSKAPPVENIIPETTDTFEEPADEEKPKKTKKSKRKFRFKK